MKVFAGKQFHYYGLTAAGHVSAELAPSPALGTVSMSQKLNMSL